MAEITATYTVIRKVKKLTGIEINFPSGLGWLWDDGLNMLWDDGTEIAPEV